MSMKQKLTLDVELDHYVDPQVLAQAFKRAFLAGLAVAGDICIKQLPADAFTFRGMHEADLLTDLDISDAVIAPAAPTRVLLIESLDGEESTLEDPGVQVVRFSWADYEQASQAEKEAMALPPTFSDLAKGSEIPVRQAWRLQVTEGDPRTEDMGKVIHDADNLTRADADSAAADWSRRMYWSTVYAADGEAVSELKPGEASTPKRRAKSPGM